MKVINEICLHLMYTDLSWGIAYIQDAESAAFSLSNCVSSMFENKSWRLLFWSLHFSLPITIPAHLLNEPAEWVGCTFPVHRVLFVLPALFGLVIWVVEMRLCFLSNTVQNKLMNYYRLKVYSFPSWSCRSNPVARIMHVEGKQHNIQSILTGNWVTIGMDGPAGLSILGRVISC